MKNFKLPDISLNSLKSFSIKSISLESISQQFNVNLQQREKLAITAAGVGLLIFLFLQLFIFPTIERRDRLHKQIVAKKEALQEIRISKAEYQSLSKNSENTEARLSTRPKSFTLFSFIDQLAGKSGIKGNIVSMKPSTSNVKDSSLKLSSVEMKINSLTMEQLTNFLNGLENPKNVVWIKRISISKSDKSQGLLNTTLQTETFQR